MPVTPHKVAVIVNPATRGDARRTIDVIIATAPPDVQVRAFVTERKGHALELAEALADWADMLVAVGGDGTVGEVADVARRTGVPLGIIPGGSTNIVARELGIPTNTQDAVGLLFANNALTKIDAGLCGDRTFLHMAGAGIDSLLFDLADPVLKRKVGWLAYLPAALQAMTRPMATYTIRSAERELIRVKSPLVMIANGSSVIAPQLQLDTRIRIDDGRLDVAVITATRPDELARVIARMATRQMFSSPLVEWFTTTSLTIESEQPMALQLDGDVALYTPATFSVVHKAVPIVVPASRGM